MLVFSKTMKDKVFKELVKQLNMIPSPIKDQMIAFARRNSYKVWKDYLVLLYKKYSKKEPKHLGKYLKDLLWRIKKIERKSNFGKKKIKRKSKMSKKVPESLKKKCRKLKVRLTVKRGKKRVYKSEKVLKKQCKTAIKKKVKRKRKFGKLTKQEINAITLKNIDEPKLKKLKDYARTGEQYSRDIQKLAGLSVVGTGIGLGYQGYKKYKATKRKKKRKAASKRRKRKFGAARHEGRIVPQMSNGFGRPYFGYVTSSRASRFGSRRPEFHYPDHVLKGYNTAKTNKKYRFGRPHRHPLRYSYYNPSKTGKKYRFGRELTKKELMALAGLGGIGLGVGGTLGYQRLRGRGSKRNEDSFNRPLLGIYDDTLSYEDEQNNISFIDGDESDDEKPLLFGKKKRKKRKGKKKK